MTAPTTEVIPPEPDEDDEGSTGVYVASSVSGATGELLNANLVIHEPTDEDIASALVRTALAAAQLYSSGAWIALQQRLQDL